MIQKEFSSALTQAPPSLTSFNLTKLHKSGDEDLTRCAARIITDNPGLKKFTLKMTLGSWFSAGGSCGRVRAMGSYEVVADLETLDSGGSLIGEERVQDFTADSFSLATSSPPASPLSPLQEVAFTEGWHAPDSPDTAARVGFPSTFRLSNSFSSTVLSSPTPTSIIAHEWGQKSLSLIGKEFARHFVYRLTEKEVEACRVQIRDMVKKRRLLEVSNALATANNAPDSPVSRSPSASSAGSWQGYGFSYQRRHLTSASLSNFGSLRRKKGHKHSSSLPSVMRTSGGFQHPYYNMPRSIGYRNNSVTWADRYGTSFGPRNDDLVRSVGRDPAEGYILI